MPDKVGLIGWMGLGRRAGTRRGWDRRNWARCCWSSSSIAAAAPVVRARSAQQQEIAWNGEAGHRHHGERAQGKLDAE